MTRNLPYITAQKLIRYTQAKAPERQRIVREFRDQPFQPFKGWYGGEMDGAFRQYLAANGEDDSALCHLEQLLEVRPSASEDAESKILKQLEAIEAMRQTDLSRFIKYASIEPAQLPNSPFVIQGVQVGIRPTNIARGKLLGKKRLRVGAVFSYKSSTCQLTKETGPMLAALLHWYSEVELVNYGVPDPRFSMAIDVFQSTLHIGPKAFIQRRNVLESSCIEFSALWHSLSQNESAAPAHVAAPKD